MPKEKNDSITRSKDQIKAITETAAAVAVREYLKEAERDRQERKDHRLHNTRLLMEKYRGMVVYSQDAVYDATQIDDDYDLLTLMEMMQEGIGSHTLTVHSIQEGAATVSIILHHINKMLEFYEHRCKTSGKTEILRRWETVRWLYIEEEEKTIPELSQMFFVDERTVYRYLKAATLDLSALFFGLCY